MPLNTDRALPEREGRNMSGRALIRSGATRGGRGELAPATNEPSCVRVLDAIRRANQQADEQTIRKAAERYRDEMDAEPPPD